MHIPPEGDPVWALRVAALLEFLAGAPGSTFRELSWTFRRRRGAGAASMGPQVLRHALAAAHPLAVELRGRWYRSEDCSRPRAVRDRDAAPETIVRMG